MIAEREAFGGEEKEYSRLTIFMQATTVKKTHYTGMKRDCDESWAKGARAPVVQRADNSIQPINHYPKDKMYSSQYILSAE